MHAIHFDGKDLAFRADYPIPQPGPGEALVRVTLAGICSTDLEIVRGYAGFRGVLGHEFAGLVEACSEQPELVGRRVVGEINAGCGECAACLADLQEHCQGRAALGIHRLDGAFAQFLVLPITNLHAIPDGVPDEAAVFVEPLAAALRIEEQMRVRPSDRVVVLGGGRLGQLVARTLALKGCRLTVAGRDLAGRGMVLLRDAGIATALAAELPDRAADVVVDCTGSPAGFDQALRLLRPLGTLVMKSTYAGPLQADMTRLVVDEITLVGSRCGPFEPALRLLAAGLVDPSPLVDAMYPLEEGLAAFEHAARPGVLKVLLQPAG